MKTFALTSERIRVVGISFLLSLPSSVCSFALSARSTVAQFHCTNVGGPKNILIQNNGCYPQVCSHRQNIRDYELYMATKSSLQDEDTNAKIPDVKGDVADNECDINNENASLFKDVHEDDESPTSQLMNNPSAPTMREITKFAIPATCIWLCGPLLSLIDTSIVGFFSGTVQQAALNPAVALTDFGLLLVAFMYTATTNLIATAKGKDSNVGGNTETKKTLVAALRLALIVGILFGSTLAAFAPVLVKMLLGGKVVDPMILTSAIRYVQIRAIGMPAAVVIGTAQSACLGMKDVKGPLLVIAMAGIVNFIGDLLFVPSSFLGGSPGAACATSISQYAALFMFVQWLRIAPKGNMRKRIKSPSMGILDNQFNIRKLLRVPSLPDIKDFLPFMLPVTTTAIGRVSGYVAMSHVVSSTLGTVEMAAQQIILSLFMCFIPVCESINLTAQTFMPAIFEKKESDSYDRVGTMKKTVLNFSKTGVLYGAFLFIAVLLSPFFSSLFTQDILVQQSMKVAIPYVAGYFAVSGLVTSGEGLLLGQKDLKFLGRAFSAYCVGVPYFLLRLKSSPQLNGLIPMWRIFFIYNSIRMMIWSSRLVRLIRKESIQSSRIANNF